MVPPSPVISSLAGIGWPQVGQCRVFMCSPVVCGWRLSPLAMFGVFSDSFLHLAGGEAESLAFLDSLEEFCLGVPVDSGGLTSRGWC